jgi:hypothetical protein
MLYPAHENLPPIMRGYSWDHRFLFEVYGQPFNFRGYNLDIEILESFDSTSVIARWITGNEIILSDNGMIEITLSPIETNLFSEGSYVWVASLTTPDWGEGSRTYPIICGKVKVVTCDKVGS